MTDLLPLAQEEYFDQISHGGFPRGRRVTQEGDLWKALASKLPWGNE